ncbi:MAG: hypothetical protein IKU07_08385 [Oscillospiraceae bacterium]|nr:hypothetical protein [Oscillospiraceae bacterium]
MSNFIYVVFSSTPYKIGKTIRCLTGEQYNHVSIALDAELTQMYSFARRYYKTPFYGGFVKESLSRYQLNEQKAIIRICKIPVTKHQHDRIRIRTRQMLKNSKRYLYNHISILGTLVKRPIKTKGAYTCAEFCVLILNELGFALNSSKYYSLSDLVNILQEYVVYTGPIPTEKNYDAEFYATNPTRYPTLKTIRDFFKLFPRIGT